MNFYLNILTSIVLGGGAAVWILMRSFKYSVFVKVGLLWLFNLFFLMLTINIRYEMYDGNALATLVITLINVLVSVLLLYIASIRIVNPLARSISRLNEIAEGANPNIDLGQLFYVTKKIRDNFTTVVSDIENNIDSLVTASSLLSEVSIGLSEDAQKEAARGGEEGKGFSVVASEVRKLAANSKQAADQIVFLAANSVNIITEVTNQIKILIPNMEERYEIAMASTEQAEGANQVNSAILFLMI